ncbi:MAG: hypothetical protein J5847_02930 [Clostridia bacterium]|nr:hypothetical protein [Clostridia bacterium]
MKKRNFRFVFEIILTLIIFTVLAIANILNGARTSAAVEQEIREARGITETASPSLLGAGSEDEIILLKNP